MAFMLYSIDEAIDRKYVVTKPLSGQAKSGTLIHVMDTHETSDGITVDYRVTKTGQNYVVKFPTVKEFCKWCRPDTFIARHYDSLSKKEIRQYLKITSRTFTSFCLPLIVVALAIIWVLAMVVIKGTVGIIIGVVLSLAAVLGVLYLFKAQKEKIKLKLYSKVNVGVSFK
ncbi:hypothetical protein SAMN02910317_00901 [Ruminococcaceae bacterium FB2012]|nr:hypothetical protein SAMN02910317_00901 [Ruminococcaceae bacterium FB2012]